MSSGEKGRVSSFEVDIDGPVESIDVFGVLVLLLKAAAATGGVDISVTYAPIYILHENILI
jgi:hypothetical protein